MLAQPQAPKKLKTIDDIKPALHELSWIDHELAKRQALCDQELDQLRAKHKVRFIIEVDGRPVSLRDRRAVVESMITEWCDVHLVEHLPEDKKSIELSHGTLGYRQIPIKVELAEGVTEEDVLEKLDRKSNFRQYLVDLLARIIGKHALSVFLTLTPKLSLQSVTKAVKENRLDIKVLKPLGLSIRTAEDSLYIKPARYQDESIAST